MKISKWELEKEIDILIDAALAASSKDTAERLLIQADNKADAYDIPESLQNEYHRKVEKARQQI